MGTEGRLAAPAVTGGSAGAGQARSGPARRWGAVAWLPLERLVVARGRIGLPGYLPLAVHAGTVGSSDRRRLGWVAVSGSHDTLIAETVSRIVHIRVGLLLTQLEVGGRWIEKGSHYVTPPLAPSSHQMRTQHR